MLAEGGRGIRISARKLSKTICRLPSLSERLVLCELSVESLRSESLSGVAILSSLSLSSSSSLVAAIVAQSTGAADAELELSELLAAAAVCGVDKDKMQQTDTVDSTRDR